ncbi:MAG: hypothetical protein ACTH5N_02610 [Psychroflexus halocasei]
MIEHFDEKYRTRNTSLPIRTFMNQNSLIGLGLSEALLAHF